jgi:hypothetical protein
MNNVVLLNPKSPLPDDLPSVLRQLADDVESGAVTAMVVGYKEDDTYKFLWPSTLESSLIISALANDRAIERFREN